MADSRELVKVLGPFDEYTETILTNVATIGVPKNKCVVVYRREDGVHDFETVDPKDAPKQPGTAKKK